MRHAVTISVLLTWLVGCRRPSEPYVAPPAPRPPSDRVLLAWRYQAGQSLRYEVVEESHRVVQGRSRHLVTEGFWWRQVVRRASAGGGVLLETVCERYWREDPSGRFDTGGESQAFDPDRHLLALLVEQPLSVVTDADGGILQLEGLTQLQLRVRAAGEQLRQDQEADSSRERAARLVASLTGTLSARWLEPWAVRRLLPQQLAELLPEPVAVGDGWTVERGIHELSYLDHVATYELEQLEDGVARITIQAETAVDEEPDPEGLRRKPGSADGVMRFALAPGQLTELELTTRITGDLCTFQKILRIQRLEPTQTGGEER